MSQVVDLEVFYPHAPERVWQVLTDRRALAAWMMENNFEPRVGHRFQFYSQPLPGLKTLIQCEVVELEEPTRLVYTWQDASTTQPSLVVWTLTTVAGGTQLRIKHYQHSCPTSANYPESTAHLRIDTAQASFRQFIPLSGVEASYNLELCHLTHVSLTEMAIASAFSQEGFPWNYFITQKLPAVLDNN